MLTGRLVKYGNPKDFKWIHYNDLGEIEEWSDYYMNNIGIIIDTDKQKEENILVYWPDSKAYWCTREELIFIKVDNV